MFTGQLLFCVSLAESLNTFSINIVCRIHVFIAHFPNSFSESCFLVMKKYNEIIVIKLTET